VVSTYPSEKYEFVSWDDDIPYIWKNNPNVPNHQPVFIWDIKWDNHHIYPLVNCYITNYGKIHHFVAG